MLYAGGEDSAPRSGSPSTSQRRILQGLYSGVLSFFEGAPAWPSQTSINEHLRQTEGYAPKVDTALPLGELGGVPPLAAD
eukprot:12294601-Heterocapsa_arctica.AAC.1